ncbi:MAG: tetratricopeptide repeat protein [Acidobacteria bacterium]|nr:tetratricopeptide repeat protein [Acidobacteriota bacterium]
MALLFFALELMLAGWVGDVVLRAAGYRSVLRRVPEFCALVGLAACGLVGYALLLFSNSAVVVLPGVVAAGFAAELWLRGRAAGRELDGPVEVYRQFRSTWMGAVCWVILCVGAAVVLMSRFGWLTGQTSDGVVSIGTRVYDDMRTIGFPISLAAFGVPLRNPLAAETMLMYPLGAFVLPAGMVALAPSFALQAMIADTVFVALVFAFVLMLFAAHLARKDGGWHAGLALVFALSCVFSVAVHWGVFAKAAWFPALFGYFKEGVNTTVGNTTLIGLVMLGNHVLAFAMYAAAGLLFATTRGGVVAMLVAFAAACSMDMTIFALVAAGMWVGWKLMISREWPWRFVAMCTVAAVIIGLIMVPGLTGRMDGVQPRGPSFLRENLYPLGAVLSTEGPYFLILAVALVFASQRARLVPFIAACAAPMMFLLAYHYGSFWFWRGHFAMHSLMSMLCAAAVGSIRSAGLRTAVLALWAAALVPGVWHSWQDIRWFRNASGSAAAPQAEAIRWVYANTRLSDLVVAWKGAEQSLVPSENYLRAGNRAGKTVYDRTHVVIGYQRNLELMSDLKRGLAANDYIIYQLDDPVFERILLGCGAPVAFQNAAAVIYHVEKKCRARLGSRPAESGADVRKRAEMLWAEKKYADALAMLTIAVEDMPTVAEVQYSLGFSYQQLGKHAEAVKAFTRALELGYLEFWARYARGASYLALGDKARAKDDLQRAVQLDPSHPGAKTLLEAARK